MTAATNWKDFNDQGGQIGRTFAESRPWWPSGPQPPSGAPNVIVVLVDDMGFSDIGPFGSEIDTPHLDRLATTGFRFTNYHTPPVCSPARAALLTGLNPHRAGYASIVDMDAGFPNYAMEIADDALTLPEVLRANGYATFAVGKWHLTRIGALHDAASRDSFPLQRGFDHYYGTMEGLNSFFHPNRLVRDNTALDIEDYGPEYYLTDDLTNQAINMIKSLRASGDQPFFLYFCHQAMHGPLGAKAADLAKYRDRYAGGWDLLRQRRFARQLALGLFPPDTRLPGSEPHPQHQVPAWVSLPPPERALFERYMEVYAAMVDNVDQNLGRLLGTVARLGELDNTIVVFTSDNGGTMEGGSRGTRSYFSHFMVDLARLLPPSWDRDVARDPELIGGPQVMPHYPRGWGRASNTPYRMYKGSTFAGGVRVPFMLTWPAGLPRPAGDSGLRTQYQYVTDLLPTLVDLAGVATPNERAGKLAQNRDGFSFATVLRDAGAETSHHEQYSEFGGHRGFYRGGWKILTNHDPGDSYDDREWELYDIGADPTETCNLADSEPQLLKEMAADWEKAALANQVFPLDDGSGYRSAARRPDEKRMRAAATILPGTPTLERYRSSQLISLRSFTATVYLDHHLAADEGILLAHGDQGGGYQLLIEDGDLRLTYNAYGVMSHADAGYLSSGKHEITLRADAVADFCWDLTLLLNGNAVATLPGQPMMLFHAPFSGIDVGLCRGGPVDWDLYQRRRTFRYSGRINRVTYRPGLPADYDPAVVLGLASAAADHAD